MLSATINMFFKGKCYVMTSIQSMQDRKARRQVCKKDIKASQKIKASHTQGIYSSSISNSVFSSTFQTPTWEFAIHEWFSNNYMSYPTDQAS